MHWWYFMYFFSQNVSEVTKNSLNKDCFINLKFIVTGFACLNFNHLNTFSEKNRQCDISIIIFVNLCFVNVSDIKIIFKFCKGQWIWIKRYYSFYERKRFLFMQERTSKELSCMSGYIYITAVSLVLASGIITEVPNQSPTSLKEYL